MLLGEGHVGEDVLLGLVHQSGELRHLGAELVGDAAPLLFRARGVGLGEGGGDEGGDDAAAALAGVGEGVPHEMDAAARQVALRILETAARMPSWASEITSLTPHRPRRASLRRKAVQKGSASDGPMSSPRTSRRPSVLTPTATITATDTIRPFWRTFR